MSGKLSSSYKGCVTTGHDYQATGASDSRVNQGADVLILRSFICRKCGDVIDRQVGCWPGWAKKKGRRSHGSDYVPAENEPEIPF